MSKKTGKTTDIETKSENKQAIYRFILNKGPVTKQDIYLGLGLSFPTIKQALAFLDEAKLIVPAGKVHHTGGRNATTYSISSTRYYSIGIYFSGNHITAVCLDLSGSIVAKERIRIPLELQSDAYLKKIGELTEQVREKANAEKESILGVGIAVPSLVSQDGESIIFGMTHNFTGITRSVLSKYIPYPTRMYHDSAAAGLAEIWNSSDNVENVIYLNLNNSIGSCIIVNGKLYSGNNHLAGELGHIIVQPQTGKQCYCGHTGCFETLCNASVLDSYTSGNLERFFELLRCQDAGAIKLWDTYLDNLAYMIHNLRMMFDCTFIIGGYVGTYIDEFIDDLCQKIDKLSIFTLHSKTYVFPCKYKIEATAAGAAIHIIENFIESL